MIWYTYIQIPLFPINTVHIGRKSFLPNNWGNMHMRVLSYNDNEHHVFTQADYNIDYVRR